jgi:nondiscriminating glutamyl-tRNA synthetase
MANTENQVRIRFAPSPTGFVHIGNLRTVIYGYLIAKKNEGNFLVRLEDTDQNRLVEGSVEGIFNALDWIGIKPDEGVVGIDEKGIISQKGDLGPYVQSQRLEIYKKYAVKLVEKGHAYYCFCTPERLEKLRKKQQENKQPPMYDKCCRELSPEEIEQRIKNGEKYVIRMDVPQDKIIEFEDVVFGKVSISSSIIDDQVLIKSDGFPTYHLAVVVDDYLMKISHVTRGEDWLPSTPKHVLLYDYFDWKKPVFIHFPNVLGENHKKLSKRQGDVSVEDFKIKGYLPEAIVNFLALLGWNPGRGNTQEIFSMNELIEKFDEKNVHKAGAVFDYKKLDWMNAHYIKKKGDEELVRLCDPYLEKYVKEKSFNLDENLKYKIVRIEKERMKKLSDIIENIDFYFQQPEYDRELLTWKDMSEKEIIRSLEISKNCLSNIANDEFNLETEDNNDPKGMVILTTRISTALMKAIETEKIRPGELYWPLRTALSGKKNSPSPEEIIWAIGKEAALSRIDSALVKI